MARHSETIFNEIAGTSLDRNKGLDALARMKPEERKRIIERARADYPSAVAAAKRSAPMKPSANIAAAPNERMRQKACSRVMCMSPPEVVKLTNPFRMKGLQIQRHFIVQTLLLLSEILSLPSGFG